MLACAGKKQGMDIKELVVFLKNVHFTSKFSAHIK